MKVADNTDRQKTLANFWLNFILASIAFFIIAAWAAVSLINNINAATSAKARCLPANKSCKAARRFVWRLENIHYYGDMSHIDMEDWLSDPEWMSDPVNKNITERNQLKWQPFGEPSTSVVGIDWLASSIHDEYNSDAAIGYINFPSTTAEPYCHGVMIDGEQDTEDIETDDIDNTAPEDWYPTDSDEEEDEEEGDDDDDETDESIDDEEDTDSGPTLWDHRDEFCWFHSKSREKNYDRYVDFHDAAYYSGKFYDVRMYVWSIKGKKVDNTSEATRKETIGRKVHVRIKNPTSGTALTQGRKIGAIARGHSGDNSAYMTMVELHFTKSCSNEIGTDASSCEYGLFSPYGQPRGNTIRLESEPSNGTDDSRTPIDEKPLNGVIKFDDIDKNREGWAVPQGWVRTWTTNTTRTRLTYESKKDNSNKWVTKGKSGSDRKNMVRTIRKKTNCRSYLDGFGHNSCNLWTSVDKGWDSTYPDWDNRSIWVQFQSKPDKPLQLTYTSSHHASSLTSDLVMVNYVVELGNDTDENTVKALDELIVKARTEEKIMHYEGKYGSTLKDVDNQYVTIKRIPAHKYSWFYPIKTIESDLPENCSITGRTWTNAKGEPKSGSFVLYGGDDYIGDTARANAGWERTGDIADNGELGGYYFYINIDCTPDPDPEPCEEPGTCPAYTTSDTVYGGDTSTYGFGTGNIDLGESKGEWRELCGHWGEWGCDWYYWKWYPQKWFSYRIEWATFLVDKNVDLSAYAKAIEGSGGEENNITVSSVCDYAQRNIAGVSNCERIYTYSKTIRSEPEAGSMMRAESKSGTRVIHVPDVDVGTKVCGIAGLKNNDKNKWTISGISCRTIAKKPSVQIWNGGIVTPGSVNGFSANKNNTGVPSRWSSELTGFSFGGNRQFGSNAQYYIIAGNQIKDFSSAAGLGYGANLSTAGASKGTNNSISSPKATDKNRNRLSVTNTSLSNLGYSKINGSYANMYANQLIHWLTNQANTLNGGVDIKHNSEISGAHLRNPQGRTIVYIVNGTANIRENICIDGGCSTTGGAVVLNSGGSSFRPSELKQLSSGTYVTSGSSIPQVIIIADNINIDENVTRVDAWLITRPSPNVGKVNTCAQFTYRGRGNYADSNHCNKTLKINGPIITSQLELNRSAGATPRMSEVNIRKSGSNITVSGGTAQNKTNGGSYNYLTGDLGNGHDGAISPAEIIDLHPIVYLWLYYQSQTNLNKVYTSYIQEVAPRY